ncbi:hypothetical protein [Paraglaciecola marina]|uniref:hypothetical protein n=1 Tax=Paraglaciecola marina TaxID=2500157 RepID=UPI00105D196C|nr:hypothetical protein [Paraglaciecola marina]
MNIYFKKDSIKARLILIIAICVAGMLILAANQIHDTNKLIELNTQSKALLNLNAQLLQLRRHEKDFLLRSDVKYQDLFQQQADDFETQAAALEYFFTSKKNEQAMFNHVKQSFSDYRQKFIALTEVQKQIGLDESSGYQGQFRKATHKLEQHLQQNSYLKFHLALLQLRRNEKDFMLRHQVKYFEQYQQEYRELRQNIANTGNIQLLSLLDSYQGGFAQLVAAQQKLGLTHTQGLQGAFREQAHNTENALIVLDKSLVMILEDTQQKVKRNSLLIMLGTSAVLLTLLIRSFITLQKAFSTFVMFFYRCKREYQHIDERKQGFSEFKYLATIANEMIDARQEMELELKKAQLKIAELKQQQQAPSET